MLSSTFGPKRTTTACERSFDTVHRAPEPAVEVSDRRSPEPVLSVSPSVTSAPTTSLRAASPFSDDTSSSAPGPHYRARTRSEPATAEVSLAQQRSQ